MKNEIIREIDCELEILENKRNLIHDLEDKIPELTGRLASTLTIEDLILEKQIEIINELKSKIKNVLKNINTSNGYLLKVEMTDGEIFNYTPETWDEFKYNTDDDGCYNVYLNRKLDRWFNGNCVKNICVSNKGDK